METPNSIKGIHPMNVEYKLTFKHFNQSLRKNTLLGLKCKQCQRYTCPPKLACHECGSADMEICQLEGKGKIVTFTASYVPGLGREIEAPILLVMVELNEGPWIMGNLIGVNPDQASAESLIGKEVVLARTRMFPGDTFTAGNESKGGIARPTFMLE